MKRGFSLLEVLVSSGILLVIIGMTSFAMVGYLRSYRQFTERGRQLRVAAKTLESASFALRSSQEIFPLPSSLSQAPLVFRKRDGKLASLSESQSKLFLNQLDEKQHVVSSLSLGEATGLTVHENGDMLRLELKPLQTEISLRGVKR